MTLLESLIDNKFDRHGTLTMLIIFNLAKQVESLIVKVQNLSRIVQDLNIPGGRILKSSRSGEVAREKRPELEKKSYAQATVKNDTTTSP